MKTNNEWAIEYYVAPNGTKPVEEFLLSLDEETQERIRDSFELLRKRNVQAKEPLVKHIKDKLWELRVKSKKNAYRIFYVFFTDKQIVFLHAFHKKTQKTPKQELDTAWRRLAHYLSIRGERS